MKHTTQRSWSRILRTVLALTLAMAMLLCAGCGKEKETQPSNPNAFGDGDGLLEATDLVTGFTKLYGAFLEGVGGLNAASGGMKLDMAVTMGDDIRTYLSSVLEGQGLSGDISWLQEINLGMEMQYGAQQMQQNISLGLNDKNILSAQLINDVLNGMIYVGAPELNEQYLGVSMEGAPGSVVGGVGMMGMANQYTDLVKVLPTEAVLNSLMTRYLNIMLEKLEDPTTAEETLSYSGVSQKVTTTTHTVKALQIIEMMEAVLNTAKTDTELEQVLDGFSKYYNDKNRAQFEEMGMTWYDTDLYQELVDSIPEALEELAQSKENVEEGDYLTFAVYNADGQTVGCCLEFHEAGDTQKAYLYALTQGNDTAFVVEVQDSFRFAGTGTNKNNTLNGKYTLTADEVEIAYVQVVDFNANELAKGNLEGKLRLSLSNEAIEEAIGPSALLTSATVLEIVMDTGETASSMQFNLYSGSAFILGVSMQTQTVPASQVNVPSQYVDVTDSQKLQQWSQSLQYAAVLQNLRNAGVPEELVAILEANLEGMR